MAILILILALAGSAVFAGSETGYYALNQVKLRHQARTTRRAAILEKTVRSPAGFLCALLVGNNIANDAAVHAFRHILEGWGAQSIEVWTIVILTPVVFVFGEVGPKQFMLADPLRRTLVVAPVLALVRLVLMPITIPLVALTRLLSSEESSALGRHQLSSFLLEGHHGLLRDVPVLDAARKVVESHGRGLQPFLHRTVPRMRSTATAEDARHLLAETNDGLALIEHAGGPPSLLTGEAFVQAPPGTPPTAVGIELPVLAPDLDLAQAFGALRRLDAPRAMVGRPGAWLGLFDLEEALSHLLAPEPS